MKYVLVAFVAFVIGFINGANLFPENTYSLKFWLVNVDGEHPEFMSGKLPFRVCADVNVKEPPQSCTCQVEAWKLNFRRMDPK